MRFAKLTLAALFLSACLAPTTERVHEIVELDAGHDPSLAADGQTAPPADGTDAHTAPPLEILGDAAVEGDGAAATMVQEPVIVPPPEPMPDPMCMCAPMACREGSFTDCVPCTGADPGQCAGTDKPWCRVQDNTCVQCTDSNQCNAKGGLHSCTDNKCIGCTTDAHCAQDSKGPSCVGNTCVQCSTKSHCEGRAGTKACRVEDHTCVECREDVDCNGNAKGAHCDKSSSQCVPCLADDHCGASAPVCKADHTCGPCSADTACGRFPTKACSNSGTSVGQCVECNANAMTPESEQCANGRACNPSAHTCTGQPRRSLSDCGRSNDLVTNPLPVRCISDSECAAGKRCVPTEFPVGKAYGNYCLTQVADSGTCPKVTSLKARAVSVLGSNAYYCFPDSRLTTCEGLLSYGNTCKMDKDCGDNASNDGVCVASSGTCSYPCDGDNDCSVACIGDLASRYCEP